MHSKKNPVESFYTVNNLLDVILTSLKQAGKDIRSLSPSDLAFVDEFHIRGHIATKELAQCIDIKSSFRVLDLGCGLGGSARYLASVYGCHVTGLDLTREYCQAASALSSYTGLGNNTTFIQGNALEIPFANNNFDMVWTEHVQMNSEDKKQFYSEIIRVLKPGGKFLFHDIFQGRRNNPYLPVAWADDPSMNFLLTPNNLKDLLISLGFFIITWKDVTEVSMLNLRKVTESIKKANGYPPLGLHLVMGADFEEKLENQLHNLEENHFTILQAVLEKKGKNQC